MTKIAPYLSFNGQCAEAFAFYAKTFGGEVTMQLTYRGSPMAAHVKPEEMDRIMHASLALGSQAIMGSDACGDRPYTAPTGFSISLELPDADAARAAFKALEDRAEIHMAMQETFWSPAFGVLTDRFGTPWMVTCPAKGI